MDISKICTGSTVNSTKNNTVVRLALGKVRGKLQTTISGIDYKIDPTVKNDKELLRKLMSKVCNTGGFIMEAQKEETEEPLRFVLSGDQRGVMVTYLKSLGIKDIVQTG